MYLVILALPLFGSRVAGLLGRKIGVTGAHIITTGALMISARLSLVAFYEVGLCNSPVSIELFSWIDSESLLINWGFLFDSLTVSMENMFINSNNLYMMMSVNLIPRFTMGKTWANIYKPKYNYPITTCTALVVWDGANTLGNLFGYRLSSYVKAFAGIPSYYVSVMVGILLGDASISKYSNNSTRARLSMAQSIINFPYLWFVWNILSPFCSILPFVNFHYLKSGVHMGVVLKTRSYDALMILFDMFIVEGKKVVPYDIYNLLDPIGIAHWIMCDGGKQGNYGLVLCTDSFSNYDVSRLMNVLLIKYGISSAMHFSRKKPRIYISGDNLAKLTKLVLPHMCAFSLYKLSIIPKNM
jgi:hypothetical protein